MKEPKRLSVRGGAAVRVQPVVRPCGHCGAKPRIVGNRRDGYYVACVASFCQQPETCCHKTRQGAVDEWNEETV